MKFRIEKDSLGEVKVPQKALTFATLKPIRLLAFACCKNAFHRLCCKHCYKVLLLFIVHDFINYVAGIKLQNCI